MIRAPHLLLRPPARRLIRACLGLVGLAGCCLADDAWWDQQWTQRRKIIVDTSAAGGGITDPIGTAAVLLRLHDSNFQFEAARDDGSDIRFVAADGKSLLKHHIEKFDSLLHEAFVWVQVPEVTAGGQTILWIYYGNLAEGLAKAEDGKGTYDADTALIYHFSDNGAAPADASAGGNTAENAGTALPGALIAGGLRLTGTAAVNIPASPTLAWAAGGAMTWSAWIKPASLGPSAVLFARRDGGNALLIGEDNGILFVEVVAGGAPQRSPAGPAITADAWRHVAVVANGGQITLFLDGESYATLAAGLPALNSPCSIGRDPGAADAALPGFSGEIDELEISKVARRPGFLKLAALNQGTGEKATKLLSFSGEEASGAGGENEVTKQLSLIKDISKSLTFDGWVVILLCGLLAVVGWLITFWKFIYLNRIKRASDAFLKEWKRISADLASLDHSDQESIKSLGGAVPLKTQRRMLQSPLYHIFQIGSEEIQHRLGNAKEGFKGLSGRSMQAIKATLDGGLTREIQKLNSNLVFLTIGIAGGPYLGLLGTVIGVMVTFAVIAKTGAVEVNSIAPGIAGALLATVAGLAVAIPALFAYSYINARIKDAVSEMQIFIDEFVAKIAEFYPE